MRSCRTHTQSGVRFGFIVYSIATFALTFFPPPEKFCRTKIGTVSMVGDGGGGREGEGRGEGERGTTDKSQKRTNKTTKSQALLPINIL